VSLLSIPLLVLFACDGKVDDTGADSATTDSTDDGTGADDGTDSTDDGSDDGSDDTDGTGGTDDSGSGDDTADPCADVPTVTYNNFGQGFMTENCQGCHASTAPNRYGAPAEVIFDTVEDCWALVDRVLVRSTGDDATMPPQGGVSADDRTKLEWWLTCATSGT